ncbi:hypothetical protein PoB_003439000 [Plakobranchus ocellatus]|uniref:Uncharacterized protein n=1 Tax=Plakobranchus ocellatus TaxID=259542 RepID=A0AAV4AI88_9GAST|nr:hypothetical protein PoB_003439000 [Plakobranchus ocellatus]
MTERGFPTRADLKPALFPLYQKCFTVVPLQSAPDWCPGQVANSGEAAWLLSVRGIDNSGLDFVISSSAEIDWCLYLCINAAHSDQAAKFIKLQDRPVNRKISKKSLLMKVES